MSLQQPLIFGINTTVAESKKTRAGVAFVIGKTKTGSTVLATCAHILGPVTTNGIYIHDKDGNRINLTDNTSGILCNQGKSALDLGFLEIDSETRPEVARFSDKRITLGDTLTHARNNLSDIDKPASVFQYSSETLNSGPRMRHAYHVHSGFRIQDDPKVRNALEKQGATFDYAVLEMQSRVGVSGSPLWDSFGRVRGMVCGGSDEEKELIFLPIKTIQKRFKSSYR